MNRRPLLTTDHDLAALVRDATVVAPSSALLDRVHASRAEGFRVMLPGGEAAVAPVAPSTAASAIDSLTVEQLTRRVWMIGIAVAAALVAAVLSIWPRSGGRDVLPTAARALPRQAPPPVAPASERKQTEGWLAAVDSSISEEYFRRADSLLAATNRAHFVRRSAMEQLFPWPRMAFAQSPDVADRNAPYAALTALDESRLTTGRRTYVRSLGNTLHELFPFTTYSVELDSARIGKQRTWRLVTVTPTATGLAENGESNAEHDTVWLRRNDLRPIRRSYHAGYLRMQQTFTDSTLMETDSLVAPLGQTLSNGSRRMPFRRGAIRRLDANLPFAPTEEALRLLLRAAPLNERWRASVGARSAGSRMFAMGQPEYLNLRVDGTREVQTLSGRFATWRVVLETEATPEVWYVSKETGETLLTEGSWGLSYPISETRLLHAFEETKRVEPGRSH